MDRRGFQCQFQCWFLLQLRLLEDEGLQPLSSTRWHVDTLTRSHPATLPRCHAATPSACWCLCAFGPRTSAWQHLTIRFNVRNDEKCANVIQCSHHFLPLSSTFSHFLQGTRLQLLPASPAARTRCGWCDPPRWHGPFPMFPCHFLSTFWMKVVGRW